MSVLGEWRWSCPRAEFVRRGPLLLAVALLGLAPPRTTAQVSTLLKDIRTTESRTLSSLESTGPRWTDAEPAAHRVLFTATGPDGAVGIWQSDGTSSGTRRICFVHPWVSSWPMNLIDHQGRAYFIDGDRVEICDPTGVSRKTLYSPTADALVPRELLFLGQDLLINTTGGAIWKSAGGTSPATLLAKFQAVDEVWVSGEQAYIGAVDANGAALYASDGTSAGTTLICHPVQPAQGSSYAPQEFTRVGQTVYFVSGFDAGSAGLYATDGTSSGTHLVPGSDHLAPRLLTELNGTLYFCGLNHGALSLWKSDSPGSPCTLVKGFDAAPLIGMSGGEMAAAGGRLFFQAEDSEHGPELWVSDGTEAGTHLLKEVWPGTNDPQIREFHALGNLMMFSAFDPDHGFELWRSDGTTEGTYLLADINPGTARGVEDMIGIVDGRLFFAGNDGRHGQEPWVTDGTAAGTHMVADIRPLYPSGWPLDLCTAGSRVFLNANDGPHGWEVWVTDGTEDGTHMVRDINPNPGGTPPFFLTPYGNRVVFSADDGVHGYKTWISDGSEAGTYRLPEPPGSLSSLPKRLTTIPFVGSLYIASTGGLWRTDGSMDVMEDIPIPGYSTTIDPAPRLAQLDSRLYLAVENFRENALWSSDGTTAGSFLVKTIYSGRYEPVSPPSKSICTMGRAIYWPTFDGIHDQELWRSDGTTTGTVLLRDINPTGASNPGDLTPVLDSTLFFTADDGVHGRELWASDGTSEGTHLLTDLNPAGSANPTDLTPVGGWVVFAADTGAGVQLCRSDGTPAGTRVIRDLGPDAQVRSVRPLPGGRVVFQAWGPGQGNELWVSDLTADGTYCIDDIWPGLDSSAPAEFTAVGDQLIFVATDPEHGRELRHAPLLALRRNAARSSWRTYR